MISVNKIQIEYRQGMTVEDALRAAGEKLNYMDIVTVNGEVVSRNELAKTRLSDNSIIKLLPLVSGG